MPALITPASPCSFLEQGSVFCVGQFSPSVNAYVQRLRIENVKRRLERTDDEVDWRAGYEDGAFFRRRLKRTIGLVPGAYRKRFRIPEFARCR